MIRRSRALEEILRHPANDHEEAVATRHVWTEAARIRDGWTPEERALRALGRCGERGVTRDELRLMAGWTCPEYNETSLHLDR